EVFTFARVRGRWTGSVRPNYYGALLFTRAAPPGATLLRTNIGGSGPLRVWAVRLADGSTRVVAINTSPSDSYNLSVRLPDPRDAAKLERLLAASAYATQGVTIGGQTFGAATATGRLRGRLHIRTVA